MAKLRTVIRHEYMTIIKQPSFWIVMLAVPVIVGAIFGLSYIGDKSVASKIESIQSNLRDVALIDESGLVNQQVVESSGLTLSPPSEKQKLRQQVQRGNRQALIVYPDSLLSSGRYLIYVSDTDITTVSAVGDLGNSLLSTSLFLPLGNAEIIALAQNGASSTVTTYKGGQETAGVNEYIIPGLFVVLFYIIFAFSVGYMLTSISEEKENRSMEMILTYIEPKKLIIGKLLAVILVTLTQVAFFAVLAVIAYVALQRFGTAFSLPFGIEIARAVFSPIPIFFGTSFLIIGFLMFSGFMIATAAITPSTKEANSFSAVFYISAFMPFYFSSIILSDPQNIVTQITTYLPLTSPGVTLLRNMVGNMTLLESLVALLFMTMFMLLTIAIAIKAFSRGALEYSSPVTLRSIVKK